MNASIAELCMAAYNFPLVPASCRFSFIFRLLSILLFLDVILELRFLPTYFACFEARSEVDPFTPERPDVLFLFMLP